MRATLLSLAPAAAVLFGLAAGPASDHVTVTTATDRMDVAVAGKPFTTLHRGSEARKPYLHPLLSASGKRVTRAFPMEHVEGESTDHPHQRGVWIGAEHLGDLDFWENEPSENKVNAGTIAFDDVSGVQSGSDGRFTMLASWVAPDGERLISETRTMIFRAPSDQRIIDIDLRLSALKQVTFIDDHDAILGLRLATEFEEGHGGKAVNAEGLTGWKQLRGARSAWVDWHATLDGEDIGVAVMDSPANFRFPTPWHVRDYALLFASPFASHDYSPSAPDGSVTLKPGEALNLRYRILVHSAALDIAAAFKAFVRS